MNLKNLIENIPQIEAKLGYTFSNKSLLTLAFVHRSFVNENKEVTEHNERLEFLGDSILGLLIAEHLYCLLPSQTEGELSRLRSKLVSADSCYEYIQQLKVEEYLLLGKGEWLNGGRGRESILADLFEALMGAIFLDGGQEAAKKFFLSHFLGAINKGIEDPESNPKAELQDFSQKKYQQPPMYRVLSEEGPDHSKNFLIAVFINGEEVGQGYGPSKKEAQQAAASQALRSIKELS